ncbi:MAG: choice-of-anchor J domain-containing protein [Bacteroidaceae bacterium]|nr:choice-of-anchor J domain-containing protein [Bacteroidaceae bacterium]
MKTLKYLFIAALAIFSFNACEDVPVPYTIPGMGGGADGSQEDVVFEQDFSSSLGSFKQTVSNSELTWGIDYSSACITGHYKDGNNVSQYKAGESYLVSPAFDLTGKEAAHIVVNHVICYANKSTIKDCHKILLSTDYTGDATKATWIETAFEPVGSSSFTFAETSFNLPAEVIGKSAVYVALYYKSTDNQASTWEVKSMAVKDGEAPVKDEPEETVEMTVAEAIEAYSGTPTPAAVKGYIVGWVEGQNYESGARFNNNVTEENGYTDILLADSPDETDATKCIPVQLPSGEVRSKVNIKDNPNNYKKLVTLTGSIEKYFGVPGLKSVTKALFEGESDDNTGEGDDSEEPTGKIYLKETFAESLGSFKTEQIVNDYAWKHEVYQNNAYAKVSGYANGKSQDAESWLISPAIDLTGETAAKITFDYVINKGDASLAATNHQLMITDNYTGDFFTTKWTPVDFGASNDNTWKFRSASANIPAEFAGKEAVVIAFKYTSTKSASSTWEVNNVVVSGNASSEGGDDNTGEGGDDNTGEGGDDNTGEGGTTPEEGTIAAVIAAGAGEATANGTVVATYARGFLMSDETGSILVYLGDDKGFAVGDAVTVSGTTSLYGGLLQFGNTSTATKNGTADVETPTATQMTGADLDAYVANPTIKYVQYKGTLNVSGYYYNVNVDGASKAVGSIAYPKEGLVADELNGKEVIVTGYIVGVSGTKYVTTMATSVVAAESDDNTGEGDTTPEEGTIAAVIAAGAGEATANGTVVATYARGFLMSDETGSILVYLGSDNGYAVGDAVTVSGTTSLYAGLLQFGNTSTVTKNGTETVNTPTATQMTGADLDAYIANPTVKYIQYKGTLNISGYYYNVNVEGASTAVGSIAYPKDGSVDASLNGKEVIVTGYAIGVSSNKFVNTMAVSVVAANPDDATGGDTPSENTIASIIAAGAGEATANGTVVATYGRGFLMSDGTGSILVYLGSDNGYAVGDAVTVSGTTSLYAGLLQFGNTSTVTKNGTETVNTPTATQMTGADLDAYIANPTVKYVQYKGTLNISGYYYNVNVEGASKAVGSIAYPKDGSVDASLNGKEVIVTGYTIGVSSSKFVNTMAVSVVAANPDDATGGEEEGGEDESNVLTVAQLIAAYNNGTTGAATITGYIVGTSEAGKSKFTPILGLDKASNTNIIIADDPNETDTSKCIPVQLPSGAVRKGVNLVDNPGNLGKKITLVGEIQKYFSMAGFKNAKEYTIE